MHALLDGERDSGVRWGAELLALCTALVEHDDAGLKLARDALANVAGSATVVDALGVATKFERMVRIADATGVELGESLSEFSADIRADLGVERPTGWAGHA